MNPKDNFGVAVSATSLNLRMSDEMIRRARLAGILFLLGQLFRPTWEFLARPKWD